MRTSSLLRVPVLTSLRVALQEDVIMTALAVELRRIVRHTWFVSRLWKPSLFGGGIMGCSTTFSVVLCFCVLILALCATTANAQVQCSPHYTVTTDEYEGLGYSVSNAGDVDNDGYDDVIVGARLAGGLERGQAYVYSGLTGGLLWTFTGQRAADRFGGSVSDAGDVNNDGYDDLIIGAGGYDAGGWDVGRAYVYSGRNGSVLWTFTGEGGETILAARSRELEMSTTMDMPI